MFKKNLKIIFLLFLMILGVVLWRYFSIKDSSLGFEVSAPKESISVCTADPGQPGECYVDFPRPVLNWKCEFEGRKNDNYFFNIQIDDNRDFSSPAFDSGEIQSNDFSYEVDRAGLEFDTAYHWRIKVKNSYGVWSDWADGDKEFSTLPRCK